MVGEARAQKEAEEAERAEGSWLVVMVSEFKNMHI
jgi:hypothetical protein